MTNGGVPLRAHWSFGFGELVIAAHGSYASSNGLRPPRRSDIGHLDLGHGSFPLLGLVRFVERIAPPRHPFTQHNAAEI